MVSIYANSGHPITAPSGWTQVLDEVAADSLHGGAARLIIAYRIATSGDAGATRTWTLSSGFGQFASGVMDAYRGGALAFHSVAFTELDGAPGAQAMVAPSVTTDVAQAGQTGIFSAVALAFAASASFTLPSGMTERHRANISSDASGFGADQVGLANGATGTRSFGSHSHAHIAATFAFQETNQPPNAPVQTSPVGGAVIDRGLTLRFDWDFSDPDTVDSQSKYDLRYRVVGAPSWTTVTATTSNTFHDLAAGTLAAGDYEWQVRTYDALGIVGAYSASAFFTAGTPPTGPSITDPITGQTIPAASYNVVWSVPDQDAYQVRRVADLAGVADTGTVYSDTGTLTSVAARSYLLTFDTNNRWEHIQVRVEDAGLWSPWASVRVQVDFTEPPTPEAEVIAYNDTGRILVDITNPTPVGSEPAVSRNDIWRTSSVEGEMRVAVDVAANGAFNDYAVASGVDYSYFIRAWGDNGTFADSAWIGGSEAHNPGDYGSY